MGRVFFLGQTAVIILLKNIELILAIIKLLQPNFLTK